MMKTGKIFFTLVLVAVVLAALAGCSTSSASGTSSSTSSAVSAQTPNKSSSSAAAESEDADELFVLYVGTNDKDTNEPVYAKDECKERAKALLMKKFGGYTIQEAEGGWRGDDSTEYQEYTLVVYLSDTNIDDVHEVAKEFIDEFHQSSILINS